MIRLITLAALLIICLILLIVGCTKERIVESTEYIRETEYVELPPDTLFLYDTIFYYDSTTIQNTDTVFVIDSIIITNTIHDTTYQYDTLYITDSITNSHCSPNESFAYSALQYHNRQLVFDYINNAFGYYNGWVFYLDLFQSDLTQPSSNIYDIYGYIDYWTPAFDVFYTLEYYWRLTYIGGDPSDMNNWQLSEPPLGSAFHPGVRLKTDTTQPQGQIK